MIAPVMKSPGSKWRIADEIVARMPRHRVYLEPFAGSGAVFFRKPRSSIETLNDLDGEITNLFRVLRDTRLRERLVEAVTFTPWAEAELFDALQPVEGLDAVERARKLVARSHMNVGSRLIGAAHFGYARVNSGGSSGSAWARLPERIWVAGERLRGVQVLNRDAREVIRDHADEEVLIFADPPYPHSTRKGAGRLYTHEMDDGDHEEFLRVLRAHPGPVLLSGYACPLYDGALGGWARVELPGRSQSHAATTEVLWISPAAVAGSAAQGRLW